MNDLFDDLPSPPPPAPRHSETSLAAAEEIAIVSGRLRTFVLSKITLLGGLTDEEGILETGLSPSTYRPRRIELVNSGHVRDSGKRRKTFSGRYAVIWEPTNAAKK